MCEVHKSIDEVVEIKGFRQKMRELSFGQTLDVPGLSEAEVSAITRTYSDDYVILKERQVDNGTYNLNIRAREGRLQNA
ncbi:hypothetical protein GF378_02115 [Candidatus Pacearchaeota archaeon]|nr:hypothetical protein [Candidatus Pacearchaeota archaeon]